MNAQAAAMIRGSASDLARHWGMRITTCLGVDLSPYPSREASRLLTSLALPAKQTGAGRLRNSYPADESDAT